MHAVKQLCLDLRTLGDIIPVINSDNVRQNVEDLHTCLMNGRLPIHLLHSQLPNTFVTPFVVINHLVEYLNLQSFDTIDAHTGENYQAGLLYTSSETIGFCTGILSALAVSSSKNEHELQQYGAVAIRHAVIVGALVDARDANSCHGPSKSYTTSWRSNEDFEAMCKLLDRNEEVRHDSCYSHPVLFKMLEEQLSHWLIQSNFLLLSFCS